MNIPMESHLWPEKQAVKRPFELSRAKFAYIEKRKESPWITRASAEAFWQCRTCGWEPWPVPVMFCGAPMQRNGEPVVDDATWEWFSSLHPKTRGTLVDLTRKINATERALQTKQPMPDISARGVATRW